jgi:hypothetical protein|eukprot:CAMPEP_0198281296 /NCGR_PEP_ID=MMETSP1449-20131203/1267_1 /TAXON_ID=420275 /ORGANISM="Attheya septentrionalis, Strain CCMP2084" /LENGTH=142 /DNA_ID=CAMNT_0043977021 /DNA_START=622 /DNA_END=1050 /DNA_ORIENTATION=-
MAFGLPDVLFQGDAGYDPRRSRVSEDTFQNFVRGNITGVITEVPGIGPKAAEKLAASDDTDDRITNTYQLIGKFLMLKGPDDDENKVASMQHMEKFWYYLKERGIASHRSAIVKAIAEKMNMFIPGIYERDCYGDDSDDDDE